MRVPRHQTAESHVKEWVGQSNATAEWHNRGVEQGHEFDISFVVLADEIRHEGSKHEAGEVA